MNGDEGHFHACLFCGDVYSCARHHLYADDRGYAREVQSGRANVGCRCCDRCRRQTLTDLAKLEKWRRGELYK